ncbi:MAG TPA: ribosome assembly cofactor RimP [Bacteroidales bacterium]
MIKKEQIVKLAEECLEGTGRFIVKVSVGKDNLINVYIDGDEGVTIDHCVELSRHIEGNLDREIEDYELKVSTAGVGQPMVNIRQYAKNIGKPVEVLMKDGSMKKGILQAVDIENLTLAEALKDKNKKSKKIVAGESFQVPFSSVKETTVMIIF